MNPSDADSKIDAAQIALRDRFRALQAALSDLAPSAFGVRRQEEFQSDRLLMEKYRNRLMSTFLILSHVRDDARRLAKRCNINPSVVNRFVDRSLAVQLCVRAGDTRKHGLGGRSKNATISNGLIFVVKSRPDEQPGPRCDAIVVGMVLVDAVHGVFHSHVVINQAIRDWASFLQSELGLDLRVEIEPCLARRGPARVISPEDSNPTVPPGSVVQFEFPRDLAATLVDDVKQRVNRT